MKFNDFIKLTLSDQFKHLDEIIKDQNKHNVTGSESAMRSNNIGEQKLIAIKEHYKNKFLSFGKKNSEESIVIDAIYADIKNYCKINFLNKNSNLKFENVDPNDKNLSIYLQDPFHSSYRYLSKPNLLLNPNAWYVDRTNRHAYINREESIALCYFWLAASESDPSLLLNSSSKESNQEFFINQLALIARAHNWDRSRKVEKNINGKKINISEEYDDGELDKPSCSSGVRSRLYQTTPFNKLCDIKAEFSFAQVQQELKSIYYSSIREEFIELAVRTKRNIPLDTVANIVREMSVSIFSFTGSLDEILEEFYQDAIAMGITDKNGKLQPLTDTDKTDLLSVISCIKKSKLRAEKKLPVLRKELAEYQNYKSARLSDCTTYGVSFESYENALEQLVFSNSDSKNFLIMDSFYNFSSAYSSFFNFNKQEDLDFDDILTKFNKYVQKDDFELSGLKYFIESELGLKYKKSNKEIFEKIFYSMQNSIVANYNDYELVKNCKINNKFIVKIPSDHHCMFSSIYWGCKDLSINMRGIDSPIALRKKVGEYLATKHNQCLNDLYQQMLYLELQAEQSSDIRSIFTTKNNTLISDYYNPLTTDGLKFLTDLTDTGDFYKNSGNSTFESIKVNIRSWADFIKKVNLSARYCNEQFDTKFDSFEYIDAIKNSNVWGGDLELKVCSDILGVNINCVQLGDNGTYTYYSINPDISSNKTISILQSNNNHYNLLVNNYKTELFSSLISAKKEEEEIYIDDIISDTLNDGKSNIDLYLKDQLVSYSTFIKSNKFTNYLEESEINILLSKLPNIFEQLLVRYNHAQQRFVQTQAEHERQGRKLGQDNRPTSDLLQFFNQEIPNIYRSVSGIIDINISNSIDEDKTLNLEHRNAWKNFILEMSKVFISQKILNHYKAQNIVPDLGKGYFLAHLIDHGQLYSFDTITVSNGERLYGGRNSSIIINSLKNDKIIPSYRNLDVDNDQVLQRICNCIDTMLLVTRNMADGKLNNKNKF